MTHDRERLPLVLTSMVRHHQMHRLLTLMMERTLLGTWSPPAHVYPPPEHLNTPCAALPATQPTALPTEPTPRTTPPVPLLDEHQRFRTLADIEAEVIARAVQLANGRLTQAARWLGIGRSTLYRKLETQPAPVRAVMHARENRSVAA